MGDPESNCSVDTRTEAPIRGVPEESTTRPAIFPPRGAAINGNAARQSRHPSPAGYIARSFNLAYLPCAVCFPCAGAAFTVNCADGVTTRFVTLSVTATSTLYFPGG